MVTKLYVIIAQDTYSGNTEEMGAYFSEENARYAAGRVVGREPGRFISLKTSDVLDDPPKNPGNEMGQAQRKE